MNVVPTGSNASSSFAGSGDPVLDGSYSFTFNAAGTFDYTTTVVRSVIGRVVVTRAVETLSVAPAGTRVISWGPASSALVITVDVGEAVQWVWNGPTTELHDVVGTVLDWSSPLAGSSVGSYTARFLVSLFSPLLLS